MPDLLSQNIDLKDKNLALRTYTAVVFKVDSTYYARKYDGTLIASGTVAETVIQAAMNLHGNTFLTGHLSTPNQTSTNQIIFSGSFAGLNISEGDGLIVDKSTELIIPNGYTGYFLKALDQGYFNVQFDGDITEAGTPSRLWTCFMLESVNGGSGVIGAYIGGNGQIQNAGKVFHLKSAGSGFVNGNLMRGFFMDTCVIGVLFDTPWTGIGSSGPIDHNWFEDFLMEGNFGTVFTHGFKDMNGGRNVFKDCFCMDFNNTQITMNISQYASNTMIIGGEIAKTREDGKFIDQGIKTTIIDPNMSRFHSTPDLQKVGMWHGTSNGTEADGILNSRMSASVVGTGVKTNTADSTGGYVTFDTGSTINSIYGYRFTFAPMQRINNCYFKTAIYPGQTTASRIFAGFYNVTSGAVSSADPLSANSGVALWFDSAVSANWKRGHNDGAGAGVYDDTGVALAASTLYPVEIYAVADNKFRFVFNGTATDITTDIPASTTNLGFHIYIENTTGASKTLRTYYIIVRNDK